MASLAAVVVAPICEEIAFRLLLQGWLEKLEDQWLGWRTVSATADEIAADDEAASVAPLAPDPPSRGVAGLPYGWAPILVSSLVFAAGHLGHGPDPIALFVLAIILGYVYQRSHHILPCILMHSLFNLTTLGTLFWGLADHNQ
jgi:membrane protease YdiL (CAAX protease family)